VVGDETAEKEAVVNAVKRAAGTETTRSKKDDCAGRPKCEEGR